MGTKEKEYFKIKGLNGEKKLNGEITVYGSKNAALPILASSYLFADDLKIKNLPNISDVRSIIEILENTNVEVKDRNKREVTLKVNKKTFPDLTNTKAQKIRASVILTGSILSRFGEVNFPHPGGCVIGSRPIDFFLDGFKKMGASVKNYSNHYNIKAPKGGLRGAQIFFKIPSVTATETFIMAGTLAKGKTILKNCAMEPEIVDLVKLLKSSGAKIEGGGTPTIEIKGGGPLKADGYEHSVIPDRLETGSFLILGVLASSNLKITNCNPKHLEILIENLKEMGASLEVEKDKIIIKDNNKNKIQNCKALNIKTHEYPGFPTDLQPPMVVLLTQTKGEALVFETIFENRLNYTEDLIRMGADITMCDPHRIIVKGPAKLKAKTLEGPDIRAGLAFLIASVVAKGDSIINNIHYIDRGYEEIEKRLNNIGLDIRREISCQNKD